MKLDRRALLAASIAAPWMFASKASAKAKPPAGVDWGAWFHSWFEKDFGMVGYYADENAELLASKIAVDVIFMGDSITENWKDKRPSFFTRGRIDRGISGQTTSQMVLRMMSDVVALRPRAVHIMGGTNDIAGNTGPMTREMSEDNARAMIDIAQRHGIKVIIASVPPAASFPWAPRIRSRPLIADFNRRLERIARETRATWVDYHSVLDDGSNAMKPGLAVDGVHPTEAGYDAMQRLIEPVLSKVLARA
ncbi:MAG TPA: GDSL-type esterase/lipase family protein [Sphingomicrobium sp.]|jgi:lysophospholipase L1-like esterase|nr:GDSL-type esterase/lipase family protein [Sphingomicrobium sp.]